MVRNEAITVTEPVHIGKSSKRDIRGTWRMSRGERLRYYLGTTGWNTGFGIVAFFMSMYLVFQGVSLTEAPTPRAWSEFT